MSMRKLIFLSILSSCSVVYAEQSPQLGQAVDQVTIKRWNRDIFPDGTGLPPGSGTALSGKFVYQQYCLSCHGVEGSGDSADELAGAQHGLTDNPPDKTIGTYWPYATTLFDFTRRSMPLNAPGILNNKQLYAVTAYLLYLNGIIKQDQVMSADTLAKVKMPNRLGFIDIYAQYN